MLTRNDEADKLAKPWYHWCRMKTTTFVFSACRQTIANTDSSVEQFIPKWDDVPVAAAKTYPW